jgi:exonuclease V gamma subunit
VLAAVSAIEAMSESLLGLPLPEFAAARQPTPAATAAAGFSLSGTVPLVGEKLVAVKFSKVQDKAVLRLWVSLLALRASGVEVAEGVLVGQPKAPGGPASCERLIAPSQAVAREQLGLFGQVFKLGMEQPLPAHPRMGRFWAEDTRTGRPPSTGKLAGYFNGHDEPSWNEFFPSVDAVLAQPALSTLSRAGERTLFGQLSQLLWGELLRKVAP